MLPDTLEGNNLGERHKCFNKLVKEAIANKKQLNANDLGADDDDVLNLINIDVANINKDVEYIMKVLTCNDILYVKRAIKNCSWLARDNKYASIINPEYLNSKVYPFMETKALLMFKELLRNNINDELRAAEFYNDERKPSDAVKWLPKCSVKFIEENFYQHFSKNADPQVIKLLCEKSIVFLELYMKCDIYGKQEVLQKTLFLIHVDLDKYLDIVEKQNTYSYPSFGKRATKFLMKRCPRRILNKFEKYCAHIDTPTFLKYIKKEHLKDFLFTEAIKADEENNELRTYFYDKRNWCAYFNALPKDDVFSLIKQIFIEGLDEKKVVNVSTQQEKAITNFRRIQRYTPIYYWYRFLPFELAFSSIKGMLGPETDQYDKNETFESLIYATKGNLEFAKCLLQYFREKHMTSPVMVKSQFIMNLISTCNIHNIDNEGWSYLDDIINSMDTLNYSELDMTIIEACIVYKILNSEIITKELEDVIEFNYLKQYQTKLNAKEKGLVFNYLEKTIWSKINNCKITDAEEFQNCLDGIKAMLTLLKDWERDIASYPQLLDKIRQLIEIKKDRSWDVNMSSLYNLKKTWRKHMFRESIALSPTEEVCINSLKHDPNLLKSYKPELESMFSKDSILLRRFLRKVRIYWPQTFSKDWKETYLNFLNRSEGHNAVTKVLCFLLTKSELADILKKYVPEDSKVDWTQVNENELGLQRYFAKNMHRARPQPSIETVLLYSKGDYLQYALPSLVAIFYNSSLMQFEVSLSNLLYTPVSLQKHVVRFAFVKLSSEILKETLKTLWKNTQNTTIRTEIFVSTHKLLCNEKNAAETILDIWALLEMFIDNLTFKENKAIYKLLYTFEPIPRTVKPSYLVKSYTFLKRLIANNEKEYGDAIWNLRQLARHLPEVMESLPSYFVLNLISDYISELFFEKEIYNKDDLSLLSSYLMCAKDEVTQLSRYEEVFKDIQKRSFESWNDFDNRKYVKINYEQLIYYLIRDVKKVAVEKGMIMPVKMFTVIQMELEKSLPVSENYILLRTWQLATQFVTLLDNNKPIGLGDWEKSTLEITPEFGKTCREILKNDTASYFPCIYILFTRALKIFKCILSEDVMYRIYESLVQSEDFIPGYLAALELTESVSKEKFKQLELKIRSHPSIEVQMHYYESFKTERPILFAA